MSILSFLWYVVMVFLFVAYLFILFYIFSDLFRRHDMNGWLKALWVIILIFIFPPLGALIYLIVYGKGMAERAQKAQQEMVSAQQAYIREAAGKAGPADQITQAKALLDNGAISQEEFDKIKSQALGS